jgi:hypothetical protein
MGFDIGGMAAAYNGFNQGRDDETARQRSQEDRDYQATQRTHVQAQQTRQKDEWAVDDQARADIAAIDPNSPQDVQFRKAAVVARNKGDIKSALDLHDRADKFAIDRSEKKVATILAGAQGKTAMQLATEAAQILNDDPIPGGIANVRDDGNGGVLMDVTDHITGTTTQKGFANAQATADWLQAYKAPAVYASLQKMKEAARAKAQEKINEERAKGHVLPAGAQFVPGVGDPRATVTNTTDRIQIGTDNDGNPILVKPGAGAGGKGTKGSDPVKAAQDAFEFVATKGDAKLTPPQLAEGARLTQQIVRESEGKVPPELAAEVALAVSMDPTKAKPSIDVKTGKVVTAFQHPSQGDFKISSLPPEKVTPDDMKRATEIMMSKQDPKILPEMVKAAHSQDSRERFEAVVLAEIEGAYEKRIGANPQQADALRAELAQVRSATQDSLTRKLGLMKTYSKPPGDAKPREAPAAQKVGYQYEAPPWSKVGMAAARSRAETERAGAQKAEQERTQARTAKDASVEAQRLLQQDDGGEAGRRALAGFQDTPGFAALPQALKLEIHGRINRPFKSN